MDTIRQYALPFLLLACATASSGESAIPRERIISFWSGEPIASGTRLDEVGSNHLGYSAVGATAAGKIGTATDFAGANHLRTSLATDTMASSLTSVGADLTYAGWIRFDTIAADQTVAARWGGWTQGREHRLYLDAAAARLKLVWANANNTARLTATDAQPIVAGQWYFVAYGRSNTASEIWLSVTPDNAATARMRSTVAGAATNPAAQSQIMEFGANDGSARMDGRWNLWGAYRCTLGASELDWLFHAGAGRPFSDFAFVQTPAMEYLHDFEQTGAACGRYSYQSFMSTAEISTERAKTGGGSLKVTGAWGQIQVFNNSNTDYWSSTDECKVSSDIYVTNWVASAMWFQMDGKSNSTDLDTNEGCGYVLFYNDAGKRGFSMGSVRTAGYDLPLNQWVHLTYLYRRNGTPNAVELYADGVLIAAGGTASPPVTTRAWHHISLGNDRNASPTFFIDNFSVRPLARLQDPPEIHPLSDRSVLVGEPLSLATVVHDVDGDPLTFAWSTVSGPGTAAFGTPAAKDTTATFSTAGTYIIRLTASDGSRTATSDCTITASGGGANNVPSISGGAASVALTTNEDTTGTISLTGSDADGDPLNWSILSQGSLGTASVTAVGSPVTVTYIPTAQANGTDTVVVRLADGRSGSDTITVNVTISPVNDPPVLTTSIPDLTATAGSPFASAIPASSFGDPDGDALAWSASGLPAWLVFDPPTRTLSGTPAVGDIGSTTITITVTDPSSQSASDALLMTVVAATGGAASTAGGAGGGGDCGAGALAGMLSAIGLLLCRRDQPGPTGR